MFRYFPLLVTLLFALHDTIQDYSAHDCQINVGLAPLMLLGHLQMFYVHFFNEASIVDFQSQAVVFGQSCIAFWASRHQETGAK
mgnify:FL=1